MAGMTSLSTAVSALQANQKALQVTAHNLSNVNTKGYVRQQVNMHEYNYQHIGVNATSTLSVGLGTSVTEIRQVRDIFLDQSYREEYGRQGYYQAQSDAITEIETIFGELEGESFSQVIDGLWEALNELAKDPGSIETRAAFVESAYIFVERANLIDEQLTDYQVNLNADVMAKVDRINEIGAEIHELNQQIVKYELTDSSANDYRDKRNLLLDELSYLVDVSYSENADSSVMVSIENVPFVTRNGAYEMSTRQAASFSDNLVPYWEHLNTTVFNFDNPIGVAYDNDIGYLKGLVQTMGIDKADYTDMATEASYEIISDSPITRVQAQFDNLVHGIVTLINDTLSPNDGGVPQQLDAANAPYGLDGSQGNELFTRVAMDRYDGIGNYNEEDPANPFSLYSAGNIEVNPDILADYDLLAFSANLGVNGDSSVVTSILNQWEGNFSVLEPGAGNPMNFKDYYNNMIGEMGNLGYTYDTMVDNQDLMVLQIDNQRSSFMGVSSDEELAKMMTYQYAYEAASRVVTVIDEMMEQIVTSLGLVGR